MSSDDLAATIILCTFFITIAAIVIAGICKGGD